MKQIISIVCLLFLIGCATHPKTISPEAINQIGKVGIISLLGDEIQFKRIGTTVLNNLNNSFLVKEWGIDNLAIELVKKELSSEQTMRVVDIQYEKERLNDVYKSTSRFPYADFDIKYIEMDLKKIHSDFGVDTIVLITRARYPLPDTTGFIEGYTLYKRSFLLFPVETYIYLVGSISVINLSQLKTMVSQNIHIVKNVNSLYWKEDIKDLSPEQLSFIENAIKDGLRTQVPIILKRINLAR